MMESSSRRLKHRLARMFRSSSLLGSACGSSSSTTTAAPSIPGSATATSSRTLSTDVAHEPVFIPHHHSHRADSLLRLHRRFERSVSFSSSPEDHRSRRSGRFSVECGGCRPTRSSETDLPPPMAKNKKKERRVRETGGFYETGKREGMTCPPASPSSLSKNDYHCDLFNRIEEKKEQREMKKETNKKKKLLSNAYGFTSSSSVDSEEEDDDGLGFFSSEEGEAKEEETETFFSSRSFSSDSSGFYQRPTKNKTTKAKAKAKKKSSRRPRRRGGNWVGKSEGYRPLVSMSSGREKDAGFAVVKRSSDPYGDFRSSMVEMIIERQLFGAEELERLVQSYLSLNSTLHHQVILTVFSDICEVLFCN